MRTEQNITLDQLRTTTKISRSQLTAVENGDWNVFQSQGYVSGVVSRYAQAVGMNQEKALSLLRRDMEKKTSAFIRVSAYRERSMWSVSLAILFAIGLVAAFFIFQFSSIMKRPTITINATSSHIRTSEPYIISGNTEQGVLLYLNGERVYQNKNGDFNQELFLKKGTQMLELKAIGTNGRETMKTLTVEVKE
ncbi:MAG: helix-turn-helix domain-containing protein [Candidatus Roizmanbacteria bacterium]|nr:helix-turn-helix domain-containing protein [Candidatus Roizmanbacteria bacterium]